MPRNAAMPAIAVDPFHRALAFLELAKPRLVAMVLVTTAVGFCLASQGPIDHSLLLHVTLSTALAAGGALAVNQYLERDLDAKMHRTRSRPIPSGRLGATESAAFGSALTLLGLAYQASIVGGWAAAVTTASVVSYLFVYTPLKPRTPWCTVAGALPGALPPVAGWAGAGGGPTAEVWILFTIVFLWQFPHSLAIARLYREDYARAGIRMLPVVDPDGRATRLAIVLPSVVLLAIGWAPSLAGFCGPLTFLCASIVGLALLACAVRMVQSGSAVRARQLLFASLFHLPLLMGAMLLDRSM